MIKGRYRLLVSGLAVLACGLLCAKTVPAQSAPRVALRLLEDIAAAEKEGATYLRGDKNDEQTGYAAGIEVGTTDRKCVDVKDSRNAVSGDFFAGPFDMFRSSWQQGHTKLWWAPRYLADARPRDLGDEGMLMRGTRLDQPGHPVFRYGGLVRSIPAGTGFFNSNAWLPSSGRWMLVTTFGPNWGCFVVDAQ